MRSQSVYDAPNCIQVLSVPVLNNDDGISIGDVENWQYRSGPAT
jgi:hypothetical protein